MFPNDNGIFESCMVKAVPDLAGTGPNPYYQGLTIRDKDDLFPKAFSFLELNNVYAGLCSNNHDEGLICECPSLEELEYYNPGTEEVPDSFILEAITVDKFSRTEKRMAAVVRTFNRHLAETEIKALAPIVGKPKKSGTFAYVAVQLPFSDGQTVNVIFHSPEGDKKQIGANDSIIAFRWLLNKRDITQVVAPEDGAEVSLETIAKRVTQLVVKNSARFEKQQKAAQAERQELDKAREDVKTAEDKQRELMDNVASAAKEAEGIEAQLANTLSLLEKQKVINAELQAQIDALKKAPPKTGGTGTTGTTGTGTTGTGGANGNGGNPASVKDPKHITDEEFQDMIKTAARWKGAAIKVDMELAKLPDSSKRNQHNKLTTKGDLDAYLMRKYGIDASTARDVSNTLTSRNIPNDMSADISEFKDEPWAKLLLDAPTGTGNGGTPSDKNNIISKILYLKNKAGEKIVYEITNKKFQESGIGSGFHITTETERETNEDFDEFASIIYKVLCNDMNFHRYSGNTQNGDIEKVGIKLFETLEQAVEFVKSTASKNGDLKEEAVKVTPYNDPINNPNSKAFRKQLFVEMAKLGWELDEIGTRVEKIFPNSSQIVPDKKGNKRIIVYTSGDYLELSHMGAGKIITIMNLTQDYGIEKNPAEYAKYADDFVNNWAQVATPDTGNGEGQQKTSPEFISTLQDILDGKYDADTDKIDQLIDQAQTQAESAGQFEANEDLFNEAADHLTELLKAKAGNI